MPLHIVDMTEEDRYIAMALHVVGDKPLWLVIHANKKTEVLKSSIHSVLPSIFTSH